MDKQDFKGAKIEGSIFFFHQALSSFVKPGELFFKYFMSATKVGQMRTKVEEFLENENEFCLSPTEFGHET